MNLEDKFPVLDQISIDSNSEALREWREKHGADLVSGVRMPSVSYPMSPPASRYEPRNTLPNWVYEKIHEVSNRLRMSQADHDALLGLVDQSYEQGYNAGYESGIYVGRSDE